MCKWTLLNDFSAKLHQSSSFTLVNNHVNDLISNFSPLCMSVSLFSFPRRGDYSGTAVSDVIIILARTTDPVTPRSSFIDDFRAAAAPSVDNGDVTRLTSMISYKWSLTLVIRRLRCGSQRPIPVVASVSIYTMKWYHVASSSTRHPAVTFTIHL